MKKCKNYKNYKAERSPTCGCDACRELWQSSLRCLTPYERWLKLTPKAEQTVEAAWSACRNEALSILESNFTTIYDQSDEYCYNGTEAIDRDAYDQVQGLHTEVTKVITGVRRK